MINDLLSQLELWQAYSSPVLGEVDASELFENEFAQRYCALHYDLYMRIVHLHGTIRTLEELEGFPLEYIYPPHGMEFWRLVISNFLDVTIIHLFGLLKDNGKDSHTLARFRGTIINAPWIDAGKKEEFVKVLHDRQFQPLERSLADTVSRLRNKHVAHALLDTDGTKRLPPDSGISLTQIRRLFNATHLLFGALSFGGAFATLAGDLIPSTIGGKQTRSCLATVLDAVVNNSDFVHEPENDAYWALVKPHKDPAELKVLNSLRARLGLPSV